MHAYIHTYTRMCIHTGDKGLVRFTSGKAATGVRPPANLVHVLKVRSPCCLMPAKLRIRMRVLRNMHLWY